MKLRLIQLTSIALGVVAVLFTLPVLPLIWAWAVLVNGEEW